MIHKLFYEELGKFLYAIANADGKVQRNEMEAVEKKIHHELNRQKHYKEHPEYRKIILARLSFENAGKKYQGLSQSLVNFNCFIQKFDHSIDDHMKSTALSIILRVANAYKGISDSEAKLIAEIKELLSVQSKNKI